MPTTKALTANPSAIYVSRSLAYEKINELRLDYQAFSFDFEHHFKTTSCAVIFKKPDDCQSTFLKTNN